MTLTNAQVLYNGGNGRDIYVKDDSGAIDFFNSGLQVEAGDILNGTIKAQYTEYNNTPELASVVEKDIDITSGTVSPENMDAATAADFSNVCKLVRIADVTPVFIQETNEDGSKTFDNWYTDADKTVQIFDKWGIGYELSEGQTYSLTGIMILFKEQPELYVTVDPTTGSATAISNVNAVENTNAPVYNLAGQRVNNAVKGIYIQNGKKFVIK